MLRDLAALRGNGGVRGGRGSEVGDGGLGRVGDAIHLLTGGSGDDEDAVWWQRHG